MPQWMAIPIADRRAGAGRRGRPPVRPQGAPDARASPCPTARARNCCSTGWRPTGACSASSCERAAKGQPADLKLIDAVAPSTSPAWFLRQFRCEVAPICDAEADPLLDAARTAPVAAQRGALLAEAARKMDELQLFIPIAAPVRWSLVVEPNRGLRREPLRPSTR